MTMTMTMTMTMIMTMIMKITKKEVGKTKQKLYEFTISCYTRVGQKRKYHI